MKSFLSWVLICIGCGVAQAEDIKPVEGTKPAAEFNVRITENMPYVDVLHEGKTVRIQRVQDEENVIDGGFAKTSRKCPPFCIHPMRVAKDVETIGEVEVLNFLKDEVQQGKGLLIDARTPSWYEKGTIPGSINIPFTDFAEDPQSLKIQAVMEKLGVVRGSAANSWFDKLSAWAWSAGLVAPDKVEWNFSGAKQLVLWCNGPWCDQSPRAIKSLLALGYPPEKMYYYRGGMQLWQVFSLTVVTPSK